MGIFDFMKKNKEHLLAWQNDIMPDKSDKLNFTEKQLKVFTYQQAQDDLRIINDCKQLIEQTTNPDVFFMRLNLMVEKTKHLCLLENYIQFSGASPKAAYKEVTDQYQEAVKLFLVRYFTHTFDSAEKLKTEKGKIGRYKKFYLSLQEYYCYMNDENIHYIETNYKVYTGNNDR